MRTFITIDREFELSTCGLSRCLQISTCFPRFSYNCRPCFSAKGSHCHDFLGIRRDKSGFSRWFPIRHVRFVFPAVSRFCTLLEALLFFHRPCTTRSWTTVELHNDIDFRSIFTKSSTVQRLKIRFNTRTINKASSRSAEFRASNDNNALAFFFFRLFNCRTPNLYLSLSFAWLW